MRLPSILLTTLAATAFAATALAASGVADPLRLALQRADMPPTTRTSLGSPSRPARMDPYALGPLGVRGLKGALYAYTWPAGGTVGSSFGPVEKDWFVTGNVFVAPDRAGARKLFDMGKAARTGFFSDFPIPAEAVTLPARTVVGEQQLALFTSRATSSVGAMVFVRKGNVVWQLRVAAVPQKWRPTRAQVLAMLRTYALKQKQNVGRG